MSIHDSLGEGIGMPGDIEGEGLPRWEEKAELPILNNKRYYQIEKKVKLYNIKYQYKNGIVRITNSG